MKKIKVEYPVTVTLYSTDVVGVAKNYEQILELIDSYYDDKGDYLDCVDDFYEIQRRFYPEYVMEYTVGAGWSNIARISTVPELNETEEEDEE